MTSAPTKPAVTPVKSTRPSPPPHRGKGNRAHVLAIWVFLIPAAVLALYFKFIPMVEGIRLSLFKVQPFLGDVFVGFDNYVSVLTDARFMDALGHTLILGVTQTMGALVVGFVLGSSWRARQSPCGSSAPPSSCPWSRRSPWWVKSGASFTSPPPTGR
ncbi:MAG: carbohydrate ABC transporter permease [Pseudarthrobacter sp.]